MTLAKNIISIFAAVIFFVGFPGVSFSEDPEPESCTSCHDNLASENLMGQNVHQPVLEDRCTVCHLRAEYSMSVIQQLGLQNQSNYSSNVTWLNRTTSPSKTQWFVVPAHDLNKALFVEARGQGNKKNFLVFDIPPVESLQRLEDDSAPPVISNIAPPVIRQGVFVTATISWQTDEISNSTVTFDSGTSKASSYSDQLTTSHSIELLGLKTNHDYTYTVSSSDLFGNKTVSPVLSFSTAKAKSTSTASYSAPKRTLRATKLSKEIFITRDSYIVKISSDQPTLVAIGTNKQQQNPAAQNGVTTLDINLDTHGEMLIQVDQRPSLCLKCHANFDKSGNHPIDVYPEDGTLLPETFPTSPEGKIICITCHNPHASNLKYLLRKSADRELCVACHIDEDTGPNIMFTDLSPTNNELS